MTLSLRVKAFVLPLRVPFATARAVVAERRGFVLHVSRGEFTGVGEATPFPSHGTESLLACEQALTRATAHGPERAVQDRTHEPAARHAIALALADLDARERGLPLAGTLASPREARARVDVNAVFAAGEGDVVRANALVGEGFKTLKLKAHLDVDATIASVARVREAVGPRVDLRVDANGAWSRSGARRALDALTRFDVSYVEQPLDAADLAGMRALRDGGGVPIAADESATSLAKVRRVLDMRAADVLVLKPMALGGPDRVIEAAREAAAHDVPVVITTTLDACVARAGALHVAAAVEGELLACGLDTGRFLARDLLPGLARPSPPTLAVPSTSGLGDEVACIA